MTGSIRAGSPAPFLFTQEKLGRYVFNNRVQEEPLDLVSASRFRSLKNCGICTKGPTGVMWKVILEWGDTRKCELISAVCSNCLNHLNKHTVRNGNTTLDPTIS